MRVVTVARNEFPIAVVRFVALGAGREHAGPNEHGLPELTARALVSSGTRVDGGDAMRDVLIAHIGIEANVTDSGSSLSFEVGTAGTARAIELLGHTVRDPTFSELDPPKSELESELYATWNQVTRITTRLLEELLFGAHDRRAVQPREFLTRLHAYGTNDLRAWHARYRPETSVLIVVGRFDAQLVQRSAATAFGSWSTPGPAPTGPPAIGETRVTKAGSHVLYGGCPLTTISLGYPTVSLSHVDYWGIMLLAETLAGTPTSALWLALRHRSGVTYHVQSEVAATQADGQLMVTTFVDPDALAQGLTLLFDQIDRIKQHGPSQAEMARAKQALLERVQLRVQSNAEVAATLSGLLAFGPPDQALSRISAEIAALTSSDMQRLATRYLDKQSQVLLVTGDHPPHDVRLKKLKKTLFYRLE
jgi:zinc protease